MKLLKWHLIMDKSNNDGYFIVVNKRVKGSKREQKGAKSTSQTPGEAIELLRLSKRAFKCEADAYRAFEQWQSKAQCCQAQIEIVSHPCYSKRGRPGKSTQATGRNYFICANCWLPVEPMRVTPA